VEEQGEPVLLLFEVIKVEEVEQAEIGMVFERFRSSRIDVTEAMLREIFTRGMRRSLMYGDTPDEGTTCSSWYVQSWRPSKQLHGKLISLAQSQSNGEKMSPGPIEIILRSSPLIADALVVGSNRPQVGCLLFPADFPPPVDLVQRLTDLLKKANEQSPSHAQLGSEMCFVVAQAERAAELPKSSKGTIQRGVAYDTYKSEIDALYGDGAEGQRLTIAGRELENWLLAKVEDVIGDSKRYKNDVLDKETDLFSWGVDSVKAARLRFAMMKVSLSSANRLL
jgi:hypothetical protein